MIINYKTDRAFTQIQLQELFKSVEWLSGNYPERLKKALDNCETVITAWNGEQLVGLINAIDDGEMTAYIHYLCVNPKYQKCGIGKELLKRVKDKYRSFLYIIVIAENIELIKYYESNGFKRENNTMVMEIINK